MKALVFVFVFVFVLAHEQAITNAYSAAQQCSGKTIVQISTPFRGLKRSYWIVLKPKKFAKYISHLSKNSRISWSTSEHFNTLVCSKLNFTSGLLGSILKRTWSWEIILRWRLFMLCFFSPLEVTCAIQDFCTQFCCMSKAAKTKEAKSDIFAINWRKNL